MSALPALRGRLLPICLLLPALLAACGETASSAARTTRDPLTIGRTSLPAGYQNERYEAALDVRGGTGPYGLTLASGTLPAGLWLKNLRLEGTPAETGTFRFTVQANDANLSSKVQEYTLNITDLPPLKLGVTLPRAEIRGATRIPLNITAPRTARAARVTWPLPKGVRVTRVQGGDSSGLVKWKQQGDVLTLDIGFKAAPRSGEQVALIHLDPAGPVTLSDKGLTFLALDGSGKQLAPAPTQDPVKAPEKIGPDKPKSPAAASGAATVPQAASGAAVTPNAPAAAPAASSASGAAVKP